MPSVYKEYARNCSMNKNSTTYHKHCNNANEVISPKECSIPHSTSCATHPLPQQHGLYHYCQPQKWAPVYFGSSASTMDGSAHIWVLSLTALERYFIQRKVMYINLSSEISLGWLLLKLSNTGQKVLSVALIWIVFLLTHFTHLSSHSSPILMHNLLFKL